LAKTAQIIEREATFNPRHGWLRRLGEVLSNSVRGTDSRELARDSVGF